MKTWQRSLVALVVIVVVAAAVPAAAEWVVDAEGRCVHTWAPASMLRGPTAIVSAPTAPFRTAAGVFHYLSPASGGWGGPARFALWGPVLAVLSGMGGVVEGAIWIGTGLADTVTGGYWEIAPEEATTLSLEPILPPVVPDSRRPVRVDRDRCGRAPGS